MVCRLGMTRPPRRVSGDAEAERGSAGVVQPPRVRGITIGADAAPPDRAFHGISESEQLTRQSGPCCLSDRFRTGPGGGEQVPTLRKGKSDRRVT